MSLKVGELYATLGLDKKAYTSGLREGQQEAEGFRSKFGKLKQDVSSGFKQGLGIGAGLGTISAVSSAVQGVVSYLGDAIVAGREEEAGIAQLNAALREHVKSWDGSTDAIERTIKAQQDQFAFSDGDQREALTRLVAITGGDVPKSMDLMRQAMDLARLRGIDLASASDILGKVYGGNIGILTRYGIQIRDGATSTEALAEVQKLAAGQAEAYGSSSAGAAESAGLAFADLQEDIGKQLLPIFTELAKFVRDVLAPALSWLIPVVSKVIAVAFTPTRIAIEAIVAAVKTAADVVNNFALDFGDMGDRVHRIADDTGRDFQEVKDYIKDAMSESGMSFEEAADAAQRYFGEEIPASIASGLDDGIDEFKAGQRELADAARTGGEEAANAAIEPIRALRNLYREEGFQSKVEYAKGLRDGRDEVKVQMELLQQDLEEQMTRGEEVAQLKGQLTGEALANGLNSSDPIVRAQAEATRTAIINRLNELGDKTYDIGYQAGVAMGEGIANGTYQARWTVGQATAGLAGLIRAKMPGSEPKDPSSPLRGITKAWGFGEVLAKGIRLQAGSIRQAMQGALSGAFAGGLPLQAPALAASGSLAASTPAVGGGGSFEELLAAAAREGGGIHFHRHIETTVEGGLRGVESKEDLGDVIRRSDSLLGGFGPQ